MTFRDNSTFADVYAPALEITEQVDANAWVRDAAEFLGTPEETVKHNLAYFTGYADHETRARVERLFKIAHPVFGPIANGVTPPEDILRTATAILEGRPKFYGMRLNEPVIDVRHADLKRWSENSDFKSCCPECPTGILLVHRADSFIELRRLDNCIVCGQRVRYTDDRVGHERFEK